LLQASHRTTAGSLSGEGGGSGVQPSRDVAITSAAAGTKGRAWIKDCRWDM
jgi:hypothetical protein